MRATHSLSSTKMTRLYQYFIALFLVLQTPEIAAKLRRRSLAGDTSTNNATASTSNIFLDRDEAPRWDPSDEKIALCFGDCSEDESCEPGLFCYHRDPELEPEVHGCSEKDNAHLSTTSSVCVAELPAGYSVEVALQSRLLKFRRLNNFCVGDCDNDEECGPGKLFMDWLSFEPDNYFFTKSCFLTQSASDFLGLVCFQRDVGDPIPQCPNKALNTPRDYCVYPEETRSNLLGECEGTKLCFFGILIFIETYKN